MPQCWSSLNSQWELDTPCDKFLSVTHSQWGISDTYYQQGYQVPIENLGMTIDTNTNIFPVQFTNYINILP